ncbi:MAG: hypothetical protein J3K34DRAFT_416215 [Monoraphidium minutum]|nr:MAG: hypothetical protein J3K34DRAFT_416215 [Monoraphidium minutum]
MGAGLVSGLGAACARTLRARGGGVRIVCMACVRAYVWITAKLAAGASRAAASLPTRAPWRHAAARAGAGRGGAPAPLGPRPQRGGGQKWERACKQSKGCAGRGAIGSPPAILYDVRATSRWHADHQGGRRKGRQNKEPRWPLRAGRRRR